jgi:hypothetical protein
MIDHAVWKKLVSVTSADVQKLRRREISGTSTVTVFIAEVLVCRLEAVGNRHLVVFFAYSF